MVIFTVIAPEEKDRKKMTNFKSIHFPTAHVKVVSNSYVEAGSHSHFLFFQSSIDDARHDILQVDALAIFTTHKYILTWAKDSSAA